jgi:GT2 family glycosyltransferase
MKVSIIIPVIRPEKAITAMALATLNAGIPGDEMEIIAEEDRKRIGCPKMVKKLVAKTKHELVCFLGDDTLPNKDWLKNALEAMNALPGGWGLVGLNDETGRNLATHWLADKRLLPSLDGEFFHTGYNHTCCDVELQERCTELGRFVYSKDAIVYHDHPFFTGEEQDEDIKRVYSKEIWSADRKLLEERRKNGWE